MSFESFWGDFYDEETREFTLSVIRDFWRALLVLLALAGFFLLLKMLEAIGYPKSRTVLWDWMHYITSTATLAYTFVVFLGKLVRRKKGIK